MPDSNDTPGSAPERGETFRVPFEGPHSLPPRKDVFFWTAADPDCPAGREREDIMLRRLPAAVSHLFRGAAGARGFTHTQYLSALVTLHEAMRKRADTGDADVAAELAQLGLGTVSI
jgi:hypothetical protein